MIIKHADDRKPDIAILQSLLATPGLDAEKRKRIEKELRTIDAGIRGEQEAAHVMQIEFSSNPNWMIIHDLRIVHKEQVAQIDHLIIDRTMQVWVCESKCFAGGVAINDAGEFTAFYEGKPFGVPSPIEQNDRHILILNRLFNSGAVNLPRRLGLPIKPKLKSLVLVSTNTRIARPKRKIAGLDFVIKNDMLRKTLDKALDKQGTLETVLDLAKVVSSETLEKLAREIAQLHQPHSINWRAKFGLEGQPRTAALLAGERGANVVPTPPAKKSEARLAPRCRSCGEDLPDRVAQFCASNKQRFGGALYCIKCQSKPVIASPVPANEEKNLVCAHCGVLITFAEGRFCWSNTTRFNGMKFCRDHQRLFT